MCFFHPCLPNIHNICIYSHTIMVDTTSPPVAAGQSACSPDNPAPLLGIRDPGQMVNLIGQHPILVTRG